MRYLFGAVSISAALPVAAREQIVAYYARYYGAPETDAASRRPFTYRAAPPHFGELDADTSFRVLKANLDALGATVPMLYKQYTELCEPGGARFLAFGVDPDFSDVDRWPDRGRPAADAAAQAQALPRSDAVADARRVETG